MSIAAYNPDKPDHRVTKRVEVTPKIIDSPVMFNSETPLSSMVRHVEGSPWQVEYFKQVTPDAVSADSLDTHVDNPYQQFESIKELILKVQSALSSSYDESTSTTKITGSAIVPGIFVPNVNDYMMANIEANVVALFRVMTVERLSHLHQSVYNISYQVVAYSNIQTEIFRTIQSKVVKTYYYDEELHIRHNKPLITTTERKDKELLVEHYFMILKAHSRSFFRRDYGIFFIPSQSSRIYDSRFMDFIYSVCGRTATEELQRSHHIALENHNSFHSYCLWDLLKDRNADMLTNVNRNCLYMPKRVFNGNPWVSNARTSVVDYMLVLDEEDSSLYGIEDRTYARYFDDVGLYEKELNETKNHQGFLASMLDFDILTTNATKKLIYPILTDRCYVLSENFYNRSADTSIMEDLVHAYIRKEPLDLGLLKNLAIKYNKFARLEQFYFGPIILMLLKDACQINVW
jgi:hypothetical protein